MLIRYCDKCGNRITDYKSRLLFSIEEIPHYMITRSNFIGDMEICKECHRELMKWWNKK